MGVAQSIGSLSRVLGPIVAGALFGEFGRNSPFLWGAALVLARAARRLAAAARPRGAGRAAAGQGRRVRPPVSPRA